MSAAFLVRHACRSARTAHPKLSRSGLRFIHSTVPAQKKKGMAATDDLFTEDAFAVEEDLFHDPVAPTSTKSSPAETSEVEATNDSKTSKSKRRPQLAHKTKVKRLDALLEFLEPRIGRKPTEKLPLVRRRSWLTALDLVSNEEEMQRVVELFSKFKQGKGEFSEGFAEAFTRRCGELNCSSVALSTFGNFAKYNLSLTLPAARWLLYSLSSQPTSQTLFATSLFQAYKLTPITHDLPSAALLAATCYDPNHRTEDTLKIANALMPHIQRMLEAQSAELASANTDQDFKTKKLITRALRDLNFLAKQQDGQVPFAAELIPSKVVLQKTV